MNNNAISIGITERRKEAKKKKKSIEYSKQKPKLK
jgi:hypothetical protein